MNSAFRSATRWANRRTCQSQRSKTSLSTCSSTCSTICQMIGHNLAQLPYCSKKVGPMSARRCAGSRWRAIASRDSTQRHGRKNHCSEWKTASNYWLMIRSQSSERLWRKTKGRGTETSKMQKTRCDTKRSVRGVSSKRRTLLRWECEMREMSPFSLQFRGLMKAKHWELMVLGRHLSNEMFNWRSWPCGG